MDKIECPRCKEVIPVNIANAIDADGEVFRCSKCGMPIFYTNR